MARAGESPPRESAATIVALPADTEAMHYHVWLRAGTMFGMQATRFTDRTVAHRWAARKRPDRADRLVLACEACPQPQRSRRRPPAWGRIARDVAAAFGLPAAEVRQALAAAQAADRERRRAVDSSRITGAATSP